MMQRWWSNLPENLHDEVVTVSFIKYQAFPHLSLSYSMWKNMKCTWNIYSMYQQQLPPAKAFFSGKTIFIWKHDWQAGSRDTGIWQTASRKWTKWDCHFQENTWTFVLILVFIFGLIAWEILFPHTGTEPRPPVSEAQGPNHQEFPDLLFANAKIQVFDQRSEFWKTLWTDSFW